MPDDRGNNLNAQAEDARRIDSLCDRFAAEWQAGRTPRLEDYLAELPGVEPAVLIRELLVLDVWYRKLRGEGRRLDEQQYRQRFPGCAEQIATAFRAARLGTTLMDVAASESGGLVPAGGGEVIAQLRDYAVFEEIGRGAMGRVYRARHMRLRKTVALKVLPLPADPHRRAEAVARFSRELEAVGRLDHPNIVRAYDAGEVNGVHYLVMEYVEGVNLKALLERVGRLSIADACEIVRQAALGLQDAHQHKLVHRDVKPSNLMLNAAGVVKILDLGLARLEGGDAADRELTQPGQVIGTLDYIAPEQADNTHPVDIRADLYSLGCTLYKLLTGEAPFSRLEHARPLDLILAHLEQPPPPVQERRPDVPGDLAAVVARLLAKDPGDRPADPAETAALLAPFCRDADLPALAAAARTVSPETTNGPAALPAGQDCTPSGSAHIVPDRLQTCPTGFSGHTLNPGEPGGSEETPTGSESVEDNDGGVAENWTASETWASVDSEPWGDDAGVASPIVVAEDDRNPQSEIPGRRPRSAGVLFGLAAVLGLAAFFVVGSWPPFSSSQPIDLLAQIDVDRDAVAGDWRLENGVLLSPNSPQACLRLPQTLPAEFRLEITAARQEGVVLTLVHVDEQTPFAVSFGATIDVHSAADSPDAAADNQPAGALQAAWDFTTGEPRVFRLTVGHDRLTVERDGEIIVEHRGSYQPLHGARPAFVPEKPGFYLCTNTSRYRFSRITYQPGR